MADEKQPVKLKQLIQTLASTMVVTTKHLDQATADLRNLYASSGNETLASMTPPRFTLDEVTLDLAFVIESTSVVDTSGKPAQPTPAVTLTDAQSASLQERLTQLGQFEKSYIAYRKQEQARNKQILTVKAEQQTLARELPKRQAAIKAMDQQLRKLRAEEKSLAGNVFLTPQKAALQKKIQATGGQLGQEKATVVALQTRERAVNNSLAAFAAKPIAEPERPAWLGADYKPAEANDYIGAWESFLADYRGLKDLYIEVHASFEQQAALPKTGRYDPMPDVIEKGVAAGKIAKTTAAKVSALRQDYDSTRRNLAVAVKIIASLQGEGILVRVDPDAIAASSEAARQRIQLTFRAESQETVQVEGQDLDIAR